MTKKVAEMPFEQRLDILGPTGWESLSLGYLILREGFAPTGLLPGRTLATFDIIGRGRDGEKILAQCKKTPYATFVETSFAEACSKWRNEARIYYFAYAGCIESPKWLRVVTKNEILAWGSEAAEGRRYLNMFKG
ncbi:MAG TPA: hypothetical protein VN203_21200 [Candidatus Acidoferrum sp.]|nr:hypothetical protein [Candidatus Acidoferrum sp.]